MEIPQRIVRNVQNFRELFLRHPLLAWNLLSSREGRKFFLQLIVGAGGDVGFHTTNDGWKKVKKLFLKKFV